MASKYVVTSPYCLYHDEEETQPVAPGEVKVRLGEHDRKNRWETSIPELDLNVAAIHKHENYSKENVYRYSHLISIANPAINRYFYATHDT